MDDMDDIEAVQECLDSMTASLKWFTKEINLERVTNGHLSEESQEELAAVKCAALAAKLLLLEHGIPLHGGEEAA